MKKFIEKKSHLAEKQFSDIAPVCYGYHICPPGHTGYGMRAYHLIHYVEDGTGVLIKDGRSQTVEPGCAFLIRRDEDATYVADEKAPWSYCWIGFNGTVADRLLKDVPDVAPVSQRPFSFIREIGSFGATSEELAASVAMMILAELCRGQGGHPDYVKKAADTINSLYMTDISVAEIAAALGLDRRYLSRIFHREMGMSVMDYLILVRMEAARKLLLDGKSVSRTAELVGYSDPFYFSKSFKKYFGKAPSKIK